MNPVSPQQLRYVGERGPSKRPGPLRLVEPAGDRRGWFVRVGVLAVLYCLTGWLGLRLALPPGYATPLWPPSGVMLAMLLLWGSPVWPGVWLGSFAVNVWAGCAQAVAPDASILLIAAGIASGSTAEGLLGARLIRRHVAAPTVLDSSADIRRFFALGGLLASTIAATVGSLTLLASGGLAAGDLPYHWLTWWVGDAMGVFLVAPLLLVWASTPGAAGRGRLRAVAATVAVSVVVGALVIQQTNRAENRRIAADFADAAVALDRHLGATLNEAVGAVRTLADYYHASTFVEAEQFGRFAHGQLQRAPGLEILAWVSRVAASELARHERDAVAQGLSHYRVYQFDHGAPRPADPRAEYFPVRYVWPTTGNTDSLGFDIGSEPERLRMLREAQASGDLRMTSGVALIQGRGRGVVAAMPVSAAQGRGFVLGVIVLDKLMAHVLAAHALEGLAVTLTEEVATDAAHPLYRAGDGGATPLSWTSVHRFGGRQWILRLAASEDYLREKRSVQAWVSQVGVLLYSALLGGFLLVLTGKSARVEQLVGERTAELEDKNRALSREVAERQRNEHRLRLSAEVFEHLGEATVITDADNRIVSVNRAFTQITGYTEDEVRGRNPRVLASGQHDAAFYAEMWQRLAEDGVWRGEVWDKRKNGECYPQWLNISLVRDAQGRATHHVAVFSDISERKAVEERILFLAQVDALTNLPNRYLLADRLQQTMEAARRSGEPFAVMFIDIDRFKNINDSLGHGVGDALLRETAERLRASVRMSDTVARHGGDEFVIVMPAATDAGHVAQVARKILDAVGQPFRIEQHLLTTTASVGIAFYPADGTDVESVMKHADAAMYVAKNSGRNGFRFFTRDMNARVHEFLRIENDLRLALERGELRLYYQPQFDVFSGEVVATEALVRWQHPERGLMLPAEFIHIAEESGLVEPIGDWVLHEACRQTRAWHDQGLRQVAVSVNLSAAELHQARTVQTVRHALESSGLDPCWLELEVTESMLMRDVERVGQLLQDLRDMGVLIALDDFGTGYSSLAHLRRFPLSALKVDRSFVHDLQTDSNDAAICRAVIALGRTLGLRVIAEGVENADQLAFLRSNRCDAVQGALFSWAIPAQEMASFLQPSYVSSKVFGEASIL